MPATKHVPGKIVIGIQLYRLLSIGFNAREAWNETVSMKGSIFP